MPGSDNFARIRSAAAVAAIHLLIGFAFVHGLRFEFAEPSSEALTVLSLPAERPPPPPEPKPEPATVRVPEPGGAASPPNLRAQPSPIVAPPPPVVLEVPPPVVAAPDPGPGPDASAGASTIAGPGTGAGGVGEGTGAGRGGDGSGGGGGAPPVRARHLKGRLKASDYPRAAGDAGAQGTVLAYFDVGVDGRVSGCRVVSSSRNAELDNVTCRLIERRFRYAPARDADGRPVRDVMGWKEVWWIGGRRPRAEGPPDVVMD